jgi:uncharacterized protein YndB with AHSA1/START domain
MSETNEASDSVLKTERLINATPEQVFEAISNSEKLARWWGPEGFRNTFEQFDFATGGRWVFTMHGPNGADYHNENIFREIKPAERVVINHILEPVFTLTIMLHPENGKTRLRWNQAFEKAEVAERLRGMCVQANEQNLDRLEAVLREG